MSIAEHALAYVADGQVLGLGTGRAATEFVQALGQRVRAGLRVRCVPTSQATAELATKLGIPLTTLADVEELESIRAFDEAKTSGEKPIPFERAIAEIEARQK